MKFSAAALCTLLLAGLLSGCSDSSEASPAEEVIVSVESVSETYAKEPYPITIGGFSLSSDTKSLYITSEGEEYAEQWNGVSADGYDSVIYSFGEILDISALAEALPYLERLFIDANYKNPESLADFNNLSELDIEFTADALNSGWLGKITADKLTIRRIDGAANGLSECRSETIIAECCTDKNVIESILSCENIDELKLYSRWVPDNPDLTGIASMKNIRKLSLNITSDDKPLDLSALTGLDFIEKLEINTDREITSDVLPTLKNLRSLTLKNINNSDFAFLKEIKSLRRLTLDDCDNIYYYSFNNEFALPDITELHFNEISIDFNGIESLEALHTLSLKDCWYDNFSSVLNCKSLKSLEIEDTSGDSFNIELIEDFTQLEELYLKDTVIYHYDSLKKLGNLKKLKLVSTGITAEQAESLRKALPKCEITAEGLANSEDITYAAPLTSEMYGGIRVESYKSPADYWNINYVLTNTGNDTIENALDFLTESGLLEGCTNMIIKYSDDELDVQEIIEIKNGAPDYETLEVYISALAEYDEDVIQSGIYRKFKPGDTINIYLSDKN